MFLNQSQSAEKLRKEKKLHIPFHLLVQNLFPVWDNQIITQYAPQRNAKIKETEVGYGIFEIPARRGGCCLAFLTNRLRGLTKAAKDDII